jgi:hypothetical protein
MKRILQPLVTAGDYGVSMTDGKGCVRLVHPILACYVADYPEQCLVSTVKYNTCPKCHTPLDDFGNGQLGRPRTKQETLQTIDTALNHPQLPFEKVCRDPANNLSGHIPDPFWSELPYTDIHSSITPDILHQVNGGVFAHLVKWCEFIVIGSTSELDSRVKCLPPAYGIQQFPKGFSILMRKSAKEWKNMAKVLLGSIVGIAPQRVIVAARALLDFIYLAQYTSHSEETLKYMEDALAAFHKHKDIFKQLWPKVNFNFPKLHSLLHFKQSIQLFGATDNYNTEQFERLHIDFAKDAYCATNKKEERPQMIAWLERIEQIGLFEQVIAWRRIHILQHNPPSQFACSVSGNILLVAKHPPFRSQDLDNTATFHKAPDFLRSLKVFLRQENLEPQARHGQLQSIDDTSIPFHGIPVWTKVRMRLPDTQGLDEHYEDCDTFYAHPIKDRFDTVLVSTEDEDDSYGLQGVFKPVYYALSLTIYKTLLLGMRVGRAKIIFKLPQAYSNLRQNATPEHLVFVEWFTKPKINPDSSSGMFKIKKDYLRQDPPYSIGEVVKLSSIVQSVQLIPVVSRGAKVNHSWTSEKVVDQCDEFFINNWGSIRSYQTIY